MEVELNMALVTCIGSFVVVIVGAVSIVFFVKKTTDEIDGAAVGSIVSCILTIPFLISFIYLFHGLITKIPI